MQRRKAGQLEYSTEASELGVNKLLFQEVSCFCSQRVRVQAASKDLALRVKEGKPHSPKDLRHATSMEETKSGINLSWTGQTHIILCPAVPRKVHSNSWKEMRKPCQATDYFLMFFIHMSAKHTARRESEGIRSNCKVWRASVRQQGIQLILFFLLPVRTRKWETHLGNEHLSA